MNLAVDGRCVVPAAHLRVACGGGMSDSNMPGIKNNLRLIPCINFVKLMISKAVVFEHSTRVATEAQQRRMIRFDQLPPYHSHHLGEIAIVGAENEGTW